MKNLIKFVLNFSMLLMAVSIGHQPKFYDYLGCFIVALVSLFIPEREIYGAAAAFNVSNNDARAIFEKAAMMIASANGVTVDKINRDQLTQGYVETHASLLPNNSIIQWPIVDTQQVNNAPITPLMRLLSMQDSFVVGSLRFHLLTYFFVGNQSTPDYNISAGDNFYGNYFTPITYPGYINNLQIGSGNQYSVILSPGCSMFWNAYLSYTVDKKVIIPYWNTDRHYNAPQTQSQPLINPASGLAVSNGPFNTVQQLDGATDGFYPVEPTIVMGGGRQNIWQLNLPANIPPNIAPFNQAAYNTPFTTGGQTFQFVLKAVLKFHGILAQNSTSVR